MARRPRGSGETPRKYNGRWRARITIGFNAAGKQVQKAVYGRTQAECQDRVDALRDEVKAGLDLMQAPRTVAAYLDEWLSNKELTVAYNTIRDYRNTAENLQPLIGRIRLDRLTATQVKNAQSALHRSKSPRAARQALMLLRNALNDAEREGLVRRNVARLVKTLEYRPETFPIWTAEEVLKFVTGARKCHYYPLFRIALTLGLRAGELMALEWTDIKHNQVHVQRTAKLKDGGGLTTGLPKSDKANRILRLPEDAVELLEWQHTHLGKPDSGLVFPTGHGTMANHSNLSRSLTAWCTRVGVTVIRMHDLRHTYASMRISQGADPVELSRELGHHSPAFTMQRYAHLFERAQKRIAPTLLELTGTEEKPPENAGKVISKVNSVGKVVN